MLTLLLNSKESKLKFIFLLFFILTTNAGAVDKYSLRLTYGLGSKNDLGEILSGQIGTSDKDLTVFAIDGGYLLKESFMDGPLDIYVKGGVSYFKESLHNDVYEALFYIKAFYNFKNKLIRVGLGEGASFASNILEVELEEGQKNSKYLNYLDITIDFDMGKLTNYKPMEGVYVGYLLKHRSGIAGLINGVSHGGSNYNSFYIEKNF